METGEDGEEVVFLSPRTQLYYFDGKSWHERGKGSFKLNISVRKTHKEGDFQRRGRFIMRAHQTFRVLLNQPVFPKMQVGDSKGREPQGKHFSFAVIDEGRPIPYLLKVSDSDSVRFWTRSDCLLARWPTKPRQRRCIARFGICSKLYNMTLETDSVYRPRSNQ